MKEPDAVDFLGIATVLLSVYVQFFSCFAHPSYAKKNSDVPQTNQGVEIGGASQTVVQIPRSITGDKGEYYLIEKKKNGSVVRALHKRIGVDGTGYTLSETNCLTMQMRELGYSEESPSAIIEKPTKWFELVPGSSKSDLANFVCK